MVIYLFIFLCHLAIYFPSHAILHQMLAPLIIYLLIRQCVTETWIRFTLLFTLFTDYRMHFITRSNGETLWYEKPFLM